MEMFLMVAVMSLLGVGVSAVLFAAATRSEGPKPRMDERPAEAVPAREPSRFFAPRTAADAPLALAGPAVPTEALLLQIERHIRLEQAAAESFLHAPTPQSLHSRTTSGIGN